MMSLRTTIALIFLMSASGVMAQPKAYAFEQLDSLQRIEARPVMVFLHADWCTICHAMQSTTLQNERVIELLNDHFYFVDFEGESQSPVTFRGRIFEYRATGVSTGIHELAEALGAVDGKVAFPTTCILNAEYSIVFRHNAFLGVEEMLAVLNEVLHRDSGQPKD